MAFTEWEEKKIRMNEEYDIKYNFFDHKNILIKENVCKCGIIFMDSYNYRNMVKRYSPAL